MVVCFSAQKINMCIVWIQKRVKNTGNFEQEIGFVTSGGYSPLLKVGVGMGYITTHHKEEDTPIQFEVRGKLHELKVANFPLFDPLKYGKTRKS